MRGSEKEERRSGQVDKLESDRSRKLKIQRYLRDSEASTIAARGDFDETILAPSWPIFRGSRRIPRATDFAYNSPGYTLTISIEQNVLAARQQIATIESKLLLYKAILKPIRAYGVQL